MGIVKSEEAESLTLEKKKKKKKKMMVMMMMMMIMTSLGKIKKNLRLIK
jgi:predicted nucleic acid-binding Zn ribbon protein